MFRSVLLFFIGFLVLSGLNGLHAGEKTGYPLTPIADMSARGQIDFRKDILPFLRKNCLACHGSVKPKGELILENPPAIRKGGESGPCVIPGKGAESLIVKICAGTHDDSYMPPFKNTVSANPLTTQELGLLKLWIDQGALGDVSAGVEPLTWRPLPSGVNAINAVDITGDGLYAACARANQLYLYDLTFGRLAARPFDPALSKEAPETGLIADKDIIQSLACSPDGSLLVSGGYRCVKVWRKQPFVEAANFKSSVKNIASKCLASHVGSRKLAFGFADGRVEIWNEADSKLVCEIKAHAGSANGVAFSGDGALLISGGADKMVRVWNAVDGAYLGEIFSPVEVLAVAFQDVKRQVIAGGADNMTRMWSLPAAGDYEARALREFKGGGTAISALVLIKEGKTLLTGRSDNALALWNFEDGSQPSKADHGAPVIGIAARSDNKRFVTVGGVSARLWNGENMQSVAELKGDRSSIDARGTAERDIVFAKLEIEYFKAAQVTAVKDQKSATEALKKAMDAGPLAIKEKEQKQEALNKATAERDAAKTTAQAPADALKKATESKAAILKDAADLAEAAKAATAKATTAKQALAKSSEAKIAAEKIFEELKAKADGSPDTLKAAEAKFEMARMEYERNMAASANAETAAKELEEKLKAANEKKTSAEKSFTELTAKNTEAETKFKEIEKKFTEADAAFKAALNAHEVAEQTLERSKLSMKNADEYVTETKTRFDEFEAILKQNDARLEAAKKLVEERTKPWRAAAFSADNKVLALGGETGAVHLFNAENGRAGDRVQTQCGAINAIVFLGDDRVVVAGETGNAIWRISAEWKLERVIGSYADDSPFAGRVLALAFSPDGKMLATGGGIPSRSGELKLWNVADGAFIREIKDAHSDTVFGLTFTADGKRLASCSADKFVRVFDSATGKLVKTFEGHTHHALGVAWRRDGRSLISAGADRSIKTWDMVTGEQKKSYDNITRKEITSIHHVPALNGLLISGGENHLRMIKDDGGNISDIKGYGGAPGYIQSAAATPDGKWVVAGGEDSIFRVWDSTTGNPVFTIEPPK